MKKIVLAVVMVFSIAACLPFNPVTNPTASVDVAATSGANMQVAVAQTLTAQPTFTLPPPTETTAPSPTLVATLPPQTLDSPTVVATLDVATSTNPPATATVPAGSATVTPTLGVLTYGTLPPAVPFSHLTIFNRAKRQAYISLQVVTDEGGPTVIEYPVQKQVEIKAPLGHYLYVAWVGGREMVGEFRIRKGDDLTITLYKDKVVIN